MFFNFVTGRLRERGAWTAGAFAQPSFAERQQSLAPLLLPWLERQPLPLPAPRQSGAQAQPSSLQAQRAHSLARGAGSCLP